jgi:hypothetical protein
MLVIQAVTIAAFAAVAVMIATFAAVMIGYFQWSGTTVIAAITTVIAAIVAMISYRQWITAHQRVVLDLFERRFGVYDEITDGLESILKTGKVSPDVEHKIFLAVKKAQFLFGTELSDYLDHQIFDGIFTLARQAEMLQDPARAEDRELVPELVTKLIISQRQLVAQKLRAFFADAPSRFAPYMRMDQTLQPGLKDWYQEWVTRWSRCVARWSCWRSKRKHSRSP